MKHQQQRLFREWLWAFTVGEFLGFVLLPVAGGVAAAWASREMEPALRAILLYVVAIAGGLGEGAVLGAFQYQVIGRLFPGISRGRWMRYTGIAAAFAWAAGMLVPTLDDVVGLPPALQVMLWVPASVLILLSIGEAQSRVLASFVPRPRRWLRANVIGWLAGLPWTFALPALVPNDAPLWWFTIAFVAAGLLMAMTTGAITGLALVRLKVAGVRTTPRLRPASPADREFLVELNRNSHQAQADEHLGGSNDDEQGEGFDKKVAEGVYQIVELGGRRVGALWLVEHGDYLQLREVLIEPGWRGQGIGRGLIEEVIERAAELGVPVRLSVAVGNPAAELFRRMGFEIDEEAGKKVHMSLIPRGSR